MKSRGSYWKNHEFTDELINLLPSAIFWKDTESVFLGCNKAFSDLAKLNSPQEIIGKTDYDLPWGQFQADAYRKDDREIFFNKKPKLSIEETQTLSNGKEVVLLTSKIPLLSHDGEIMGVLGIYHDITERKQMELSLSQSKTAAEAANHAKTEFIANMSHDIRTPLTGVVGMSHMLEDTLSDPTQKQYAHWLGESGDQLLNMLNGILDVVSADNVNECDLHQEQFNLRQMLHDIVELERPTTQVKGLELRCHIDERIPKFFISDRTKIHRILLNLLGNAIKFTSKGSVEVGVDLVELHKNNVVLTFRVTDTGIGIPLELQDKVFDRFFRVTPSYKGIYTGHGVGLHIAQSYAHLLGGDIRLSSEPNVGTSFYFDLTLTIASDALLLNDKPHQDTQSSLTKTADEPHPLSSIITSNLNAPTLLLVEDNAIALKLLECLVSNMGLNHVSAMDGETALQLATEQVFDLIITDLGLPALSGMGFTQQLRLFERTHHRTRVPVVGLTAHADEAVKQECVAAGMDEIYSKPMTTSCLSQITDTYLSSETQIVVGLQRNTPSA